MVWTLGKVNFHNPKRSKLKHNSYWNKKTEGRWIFLSPVLFLDYCVLDYSEVGYLACHYLWASVWAFVVAFSVVAFWQNHPYLSYFSLVCGETPIFLGAYSIFCFGLCSINCSVKSRKMSTESKMEWYQGVFRRC